jgi:hypothetical protein
MMRRVGRFLRQSKGLGQWSNFIARAMQQLWRNRIPADATESGQAVGKKQQKLLGTEKPPIQGPPFPLPPRSFPMQRARSQLRLQTNPKTKNQ